MKRRVLEQRSLIAQGDWAPARFREALMRVPFLERDAWVDCVLGLAELPADGPALPRDGVPYLPVPVDALLLVAEQVRPSDVFVDIGAGVGRPAVLVHLLSGAVALGIEIQPQLVCAARELSARLRLASVSFVEGDAVARRETLAKGSVFFLYCPFSGPRLVALLAALEAIAQQKQIRVCCVDVPLPACGWLEKLPASSPAVEVFQSR